MQMTMFGTPAPAKPRKLSTQPALPFGPAIDSGRRGEPHYAWLDAVIQGLRSLDVVPNLAEIQARWDRNLAPSDAVASLSDAVASLSHGA